MLTSDGTDSGTISTGKSVGDDGGVIVAGKRREWLRVVISLAMVIISLVSFSSIETLHWLSTLKTIPCLFSSNINSMLAYIKCLKMTGEGSFK